MAPGKALLVRGALRYLWEELKTMNLNKLSALANILKGYLKMKFGTGKTVPARAREVEYKHW